MFFLIVIIILLIVWATNEVSSGNHFRDDSQSIRVGMTTREVVNIMGNPSYTKEFPDGTYEFVYEKSEWKGFFRGGTIVRRMECVFSDEDILISIGKNANCDLSGW